MLAEQLRGTSPLEALAVILAIAYLLLAIRRNIWCWLCAGTYTAIYIYLFYDARLYMESVLHVFYCAMAVYGWYAWYFGRREPDGLPVTAWPLRVHALAIAAVAGIGIVNGFALAAWTDAEFPFVDSLTTWGSLWATFLLARKVFENWWYWLAIDVASIAMYWLRDLQLTALLYVAFVLMIPFGIVSWRRALREQRP